MQEVRHGGFLGMRKSKEMLLDHRQPGKQGGNRQNQHRHKHGDRLLVGMLGVLAASLAEENTEKLAENVEGCQTSGGGGEPAEERNFHHSPFDNEVFTEVTAGVRATGEREHSRDEANHRNGCLFTKTSHVPHVGLVVHGDHHGTRREEEEALEASVGEKVKHRLVRGRRHRDAEDHVAKLGNR